MTDIPKDAIVAATEPVSALVKFLTARLGEDHERGTGDARFSSIEAVAEYGERMVADVEAKRRIVDLHPHTTQREQQGETSLRRNYGPHWEKRLKHLDEFYCERCHVEDGVIEGDGGRPCETLRLLALPYADHPDYDGSWRP